MENIEDKVLITNIQRMTPNFIKLRESRINEALSFECGESDNQIKTVIHTLENGKDVYFLKPGKEVFRLNPNIYDMYPCIGRELENETQFQFDDIWEYLVKISIINQITFKKVLILLYRICYFIDHQIINSNLRYRPSEDILNIIKIIDYSLKDSFIDKFKTKEIGLMELFHFVDILGWNEDVKYHTVNNKATFDGKYNKCVGRVNTILTLISVPLLVNDFLHNIMDNVKHIEKINVRLILNVMQKFAKSRGICVLPHKKIANKLNPYLI